MLYSLSTRLGKLIVVVVVVVVVVYIGGDAVLRPKMMI